MRIACAMFVAMVFSVSAIAMELDNNRSSLNFLSVKNGATAEVGTFSALAGSLNKSGELTLTIDMASLSTNIEIRDERMREFLFEVAGYPQATFTAKVSMAGIDGMTPGDERPLKVEGQLELHGVAQQLSADLRVVKLSDGSLRANTLAPILLQASQFKLDSGIEKLRSLASLESIDTVVPVSFSLVFVP